MKIAINPITPPLPAPLEGEGQGEGSQPFKSILKQRSLKNGNTNIKYA
jgi:hypothetical protein